MPDLDVGGGGVDIGRQWTGCRDISGGVMAGQALDPLPHRLAP